MVRLDISNQEPYVQATDLTGTMDMTINAECGMMRPRMGTDVPTPEGECGSVKPRAWSSSGSMILTCVAPVASPVVTAAASGGLSGVFAVPGKSIAHALSFAQRNWG